MKDLRLGWEPENLTPLGEIEERLMAYTKGRGGITILKNGTLLSLTAGADEVDDARKAMHEARFLIDFRVVPLKEGGYMVAFHKAVAVFVGEAEYLSIESEVVARQGELRFPGEHFFVPDDAAIRDHLVGLYARGKLQRDARCFSFHKKI